MADISKITLPNGDIYDLKDSRIPVGAVFTDTQADWNETDSTSPAYIANKPTIPQGSVVDSTLSTTSENPVQNKVINSALDNKMDKSNPTGTGSFSLNRKENTTVGNYSFAEGYNTTSNGFASHAEGDTTTASGNYGSHAEGGDTIASGNNSHAEGKSTTASGYASHAGGQYTTANTKSQTVIGEYNVLDTGGSTVTRGDYAFIIGNGAADNARSNALTVGWDGIVDMTGNLKFGATNIGIWGKDSSGYTYPMLYNNNVHLWIGATQSADQHHRGGTYISSGHNGSAGYETIYISVPNAANNGATNYKVAHAGNIYDLLCYANGTYSERAHATGYTTSTSGTLYFFFPLQKIIPSGATISNYSITSATIRCAGKVIVNNTSIAAANIDGISSHVGGKYLNCHCTGLTTNFSSTQPISVVATISFKIS